MEPLFNTVNDPTKWIKTDHFHPCSIAKTSMLQQGEALYTIYFGCTSLRFCPMLTLPTPPNEVTSTPQRYGGFLIYGVPINHSFHGIFHSKKPIHLGVPLPLWKPSYRPWRVPLWRLLCITKVGAMHGSARLPV